MPGLIDLPDLPDGPPDLPPVGSGGVIARLVGAEFVEPFLAATETPLYDSGDISSL